ncbi:MAG: tripartite tricarboxylate transporter substrate binding protein [Pseudomonadota bacterium]
MMRYCTVLARILTVGVLTVFSGALGAQQGYPNKPIRWITPYPPGGSTTMLSRLVGQKMAESWKQAVIIDNRPGGNTIIGTDIVAKAAPDGYTLLLGGNTQLINALLLHPPYDIFKDLAPISIIAKTNYVLIVNPKLPVNNLQEFIAYAKARPGQLNVASVASGGTQHLMGVLFNILAGVDMMHIPYKGGAAGITDLMGGQVQASFSNAINVISHIKNGRLKGLAVTGHERLAALPQVPTYAESGLPSYDPKNWQGVLATAGAPKAIINKLSAEVGRILAMPEIKEKLRSLGAEPYPTTPEQMAAEMKSAHAEYAKVIATAKIKVE